MMAKRSDNGGEVTVPGDGGGGEVITTTEAVETGQEAVPAVGPVPASQEGEGEVPGAGPVLHDATGTPVNVQEEFIRPALYEVGQPAPRTIYGTIGPDGAVTPVEGDLEPGTRGVVIAQEGEALSTGSVRLLNDAQGGAGGGGGEGGGGEGGTGGGGGGGEG